MQWKFSVISISNHSLAIAMLPSLSYNKNEKCKRDLSCFYIVKLILTIFLWFTVIKACYFGDLYVILLSTYHNMRDKALTVYMSRNEIKKRMNPSSYLFRELVHINPLVPEFFFSSFFGTLPKIGSFPLPTHSRDAHRIFFFLWSLLILESKFWQFVPFCAH